jgi:hypothetical protein
MHDTAFEQKLRSALQAEGDGLALTITAAELERRLVLRRRGRPSSVVSIGLAAAFGVALIGLAGVVGGWFEARPIVPAPLPSASAPASSTPSPVPTIGPSILPSGVFPDRLPSLDELLAPLDQARIVRAQAVGPAEGPSGSQPSREQIGPMAVGFAPITTPGSYRLYVACIGSAGLNVAVTSDQATEARELIPITCNGAVTARDTGLEAGDRLALRSTSWLSWRVVLEAPERAPLHALGVGELGDIPPGETELAVGQNQVEAPSYADNLTGGGILVPIPVGALPGRDRYTVQVTCAGPTTLRYTFGRTILGTDTAADGTIDEFSATEVECDGASHSDAIDIVQPSGAEFFVTVDARTAWTIRVTAEEAPIALDPGDIEWQMVVGSGPDLDYDGQESGLSGMTNTDGNTEIRVDVTCLGGGWIDVTVSAGGIEDPPTLGSFRADCRVEGATSTAQVVQLRSQAFLVVADPSGKMWRAITVQERAPATRAADRSRRSCPSATARRSRPAAWSTSRRSARSIPRPASSSGARSRARPASASRT